MDTKIANEEESAAESDPYKEESLLAEEETLSQPEQDQTKDEVNLESVPAVKLNIPVALMKG